ncbi:MAG: phosphotransferase, partial [Lachnospiraceae bacterium]|nr:phosphotransferase [Lachnospiraceae bacterium]
EIPDSLPMIENEQKRAKQAFLRGIPTAISYDVVKVGDSYGSVFELLNSRSFAKILAEEPERMDWCVREYVEILKKIHETRVPAGKLPPLKAKAQAWVGRMKSALPAPYGEKIQRMIDAIPERDTLLHGDFHTKNIVLAGDEVLLIDMDTLSVGNPIFELAQVYNAYVGFSEYDPEIVWRFQGFDAHVADAFWKKSLQAYFQTQDEENLQKIESKVRCVAYAFLIAWNLEEEEKSEEDQKTLELWMQRLCGLLREVDTLII